MEPIKPELLKKWKSLGITDEEIDEWQRLLACRFTATDKKTRDFYEEKIKNCSLCKQLFAQDSFDGSS